MAVLVLLIFEYLAAVPSAMCRAVVCLQVPPPEVDLLTAGSMVPDIQTEIVVQSSPPGMTM